MQHLLHSNPDTPFQFNVTPERAGWTTLSFRIQHCRAGETIAFATGADEIALVPLQGDALLQVDGNEYPVHRENVWVGPPSVLYTPPNKTVTVVATTDFEFAVGSAPADGIYPVRLFEAHEMKQEIRGGGAATRQVNHILAPPLPAERLILFEVYVPGGSWSGWPPHCHDGYEGSPYLEETYYYRIDPPTGFAIHRNYRLDTDFDELLPVRSGDLVLVTQGFHPVAAAPGSNVYFLNYLAGELRNEARATPPLDDPAHAWIKGNWEGNRMKLPIQKA